MFEWLRGKREQKRAAAGPTFKLTEIPGALDASDGIPRIDWAAVEAWAASRPDGEDANERWCELQRQWVDEVADALGEPYVWVESDELILLSGRDGGNVRGLLGMADRAYAATCQIVGPPTERQGKLVILCFGAVETFYDYLAPLFPEGSYGGVGGICVRDGDTHIALPDVGHAVESTLIHEMVHVCLGDDVPGWLQEGVAEIVPERITGNRRPALSERDVRRHRHHWAKRGLQCFWAGEGFTHDDRGQELSYELAYLLVSVLVGDRGDRVAKFLRAAGRADFGAAAAREHLGMSLGELAGQFLGPGDWEPKPGEAEGAEAGDTPPTVRWRRAFRGCAGLRRGR